MIIVDEWWKIVSAPLLSKTMNMELCTIVLESPLFSEDLVAVFERHRKHFLYVSSMVYGTVLEND